MRLFRADAAFTVPDLYKTPEAEGCSYAIRPGKTAVPESRIAPVLKRPAGRPPTHVQRICGDFEYQAASRDKPSWDKPWRVVRHKPWRVVRHARAVTFQPAGAAVGGALFTRIPAAIQRLRAPPVPASATCMTVSAIKPGRKRLDGSDPAGAGQIEFRFKPVAASINRARFTNRMPEPRHGPPKRLDPYAKQRQHDRNSVLIGECRLDKTHDTASFEDPVESEP